MSALLDDLSDWFIHEVQVTRRTFDGYGAMLPSGETFTVPSYVYGSAQKVVSKGIMRDSKYIMVTNGYFSLTDQDLYTLPAQFFVRSGECLTVADHTDEDGPHHQTVYF